MICSFYLSVLSEQNRSRDTLACCWDVKQPTKRQTNNRLVVWLLRNSPMPLIMMSVCTCSSSWGSLCSSCTYVRLEIYLHTCSQVGSPDTCMYEYTYAYKVSQVLGEKKKNKKTWKIAAMVSDCSKTKLTLPVFPHGRGVSPEQGGN